MKILAALLLVGLLYGLPVHLFDTLVLPELFSLREVYGNAERLGDDVAAEAK